MRHVGLAIAFAAFTTVAAAQPRAAVLRIDGFPTTDAPEIASSTIDEALAGLPFATVGTLGDLTRFTTLLLPYGSSFPLDEWPNIRAFIARGGNLVVLGGAPFHQPVLPGNVLGVRQPTWAHELLIGPAERIAVPVDATVVMPQRFWTTAVAGARNVYALTLRLARDPTMRGEHGSEGEREAVVRPLVHIVQDGLPRATPLLEIDRLHGPGAGGRWIFAASDAPLSATVIREIVRRAMRGASHIEARPVHATIAADESPRIILDRPATVTVLDDNGRRIHQQMTLEGENELRIRGRLRPGLYHVTANAAGDLAASTGFWVRDDALLRRGPKLTVSRDWLRADGAVLPVIGTTYMASDVHRQFLFEPNPHVWDADFAAMKRIGINFVRTGLWTAWSRALDAEGNPNEPFLRALDAYVHTAAKHGIFVNFTFYAFQPLAHGGANPYLDPKSLEGQRRLLTAVASRYRGVGWIHYDLINEPSYAPAANLWSNRPIRDVHERDAWNAWIRQRHGDSELVLQHRWQDRSDDLHGVPRENELWHTQLREDRRPRKHRDFVEFTNDAVAGWARTLRGYLRDAGGDVLVTLGQDEGGTHHRPSQQLHADAIDYTSLHPWWQNDDVLANGVFIKVPEKPSLFQETGIMRLEDVDGWHWRSPESASSLLERKFAAAFAARAAGNVQWAWNINPFMPIDNESVIGFIRPDGTVKPEIDVVRMHADFFRAAATWLDDFEPDPVVIVIPQSRLFMNRPAALDGYRRAVRLMGERFGVVPTALSDLRLAAERLKNAKLVIAPSLEFLNAQAAEALLAARRGEAESRSCSPARSRVMFTERRLRHSMPSPSWIAAVRSHSVKRERRSIAICRRAFSAATSLGANGTSRCRSSMRAKTSLSRACCSARSPRRAWRRIPRKASSSRACSSRRAQSSACSSTTRRRMRGGASPLPAARSMSKCAPAHRASCCGSGRPAG